MEEGDLCCVLDGAHVPMILRKTQSQTLRLVGESYVQELMFEAEAEAEMKQQREFLLV